MKNDNMRQAIDSELRGLRVSDSLRRRVLDGAADEKVIALPQRRPRLRVALAAACAAVMLLATVAVAAANRWGVLDFFGNSAKPLIAADGADAYVQTNLGEARCEDLVITLRELAFDGKGVRYVLDAEPAREGVWLYSDWTDWTEEQLARPGRVELPVSFAELDCPDYDGHVVDVEPTENGLSFYEEGWIDGDFADSLSGVVRLGELEVPFAVQAAPAQVYRLTPSRESDYIDILDITLTHTPMANYLRVSYREKPLDGDAFAIDGDATYYTLENGTFFHADRLCGGMENALPMTGAELKATDKRPCPLCLAKDGPNTSYWNFCLLDEAGEPLNSAGGSGGPLDGDIRESTEVMQRTEPRAAWTVRVKDWGEAVEDIPCEAVAVDKKMP